jgi:hypothetical protein
MTQDRATDWPRRGGTEDWDMSEHGTLHEGDIVEFTLRGERRTAEVMLVTDDGAAGDTVLLDLFDGDRPAWARVTSLVDVAVYRPELADALVAA